MLRQNENMLHVFTRRFLLLLLVCFTFFLFNSPAAATEDNLDDQEIMKLVNKLYKDMFEVPRFIKINSTVVTRKLGMADTIATNVIHIYQDGPLAKMEILPGTIRYSDLASTPFDESSIKPKISHKRNEWVTDGKTLKILYESHPSNDAHGKTVVTAKKIDLEGLHPEYRSMLETMNMEISDVWMEADYTVKEIVYEGKKHIHLASKGFFPVTNDTNAKIEMWLDPGDYSVQRLEIDMEHTMGKETVYIETILDIVFYHWGEDKPGSQKAGAEALTLSKNFFDLELPDNYEDLTKELSKKRPLKPVKKK